MRRIILIALGVLVACCGLVSIWWWLPNSPNPRTIPVNLTDLLLDISEFPPGWGLADSPKALPDRARLEHGGQETIIAKFVPQDNEFEDKSAEHTVYRYRNVYDATQHFDKYFSNKFRDRDGINLQVPEGLSYTSPYADRFRFACAEIDFMQSYRSCLAVTQYDEFISEFRIVYADEKTTLDDFEIFLGAIEANVMVVLELEENKD